MRNANLCVDYDLKILRNGNCYNVSNGIVTEFDVVRKDNQYYLQEVHND